MSQNERGTLYPFRLSGSRMRRSAMELRRHGQTLDALTLIRRAAEQDDTPAAWLALAAELRQTGNWEAASRLLARVLSRDAHHPGAWLEMARCLQALGHPEAAMDAACRQLQEDPWSKEGDAARRLLAEMDAVQDAREPRRTQRMIHRGMRDWQSGDRSLGERRIRRALRISESKERLLVTAAMMCMLDMDLEGAFHYLPRALRYQPEDARTLTALSTLYTQLGKRRMARGFLRLAGQYAASVQEEDGFLTTAWAQDAWPEMQAYLDRRLKQTPCRTMLLAAKATMYCETQNMQEARQIWRTILAIDPDDRAAASRLSASQQGGAAMFHAPGMLPRAEQKRQMTELQTAAESLEMTELLRPGSRTRRLMDWLITSGDAAEQQTAFAALEGKKSSAAAAYLKELLCQPFLRPEVRQRILVCLAEMGCRDEMLIFAGGRFNCIACQKIDETKPERPWRRFLPVLLQEGREHLLSREMAELAAALWPALTPQQRREAAGLGSLKWCKAVEILCLRMAGEEELAIRVAEQTPLSKRKISRVLRQIGRCMEAEPVTE